jgi:hypothetical protein
MNCSHQYPPLGAVAIGGLQGTVMCSCDREERGIRKVTYFALFAVDITENSHRISKRKRKLKQQERGKRGITRMVFATLHSGYNAPRFMITFDQRLLTRPFVDDSSLTHAKGATTLCSSTYLTLRSINRSDPSSISGFENQHPIFSLRACLAGFVYVPLGLIALGFAACAFPTNLGPYYALVAVLLAHGAGKRALHVQSNLESSAVGLNSIMGALVAGFALVVCSMSLVYTGGFVVSGFYSTVCVREYRTTHLIIRTVWNARIENVSSVTVGFNRCLTQYV